MILLLGMASTGMILIAAHPYTQYGGIGSSGIHATPDGSIHIPGDIIFESNTNQSVTITHNATNALNINILDLNGTTVTQDINITSIELQGSLLGTFDESTGTLIIKLEQISCPLLQGVKSVDSNGNLVCGII